MFTNGGIYGVCELTLKDDCKLVSRSFRAVDVDKIHDYVDKFKKNKISIGMLLSEIKDEDEVSLVVDEDEYFLIKKYIKTDIALGL